LLKAVCDVRLIALVLIKYWLDVDEICLDVCCSNADRNVSEFASWECYIIQKQLQKLLLLLKVLL